MDEMGSRFKCVIDDEEVIKEFLLGATVDMNGTPIKVGDCLEVRVPYLDGGFSISLIADNYIEIDYLVPSVRVTMRMGMVAHMILRTIKVRFNENNVIALRKNINDTIRIVTDDEDQIVLK